MNEHIRQEFLWKNQNLTQSPAIDNSFEEKAYHRPEKNERSLNPPNSKVMSKTFSEIDPGSYVDGIINKNNNDVPMSKFSHNSDPAVSDEYLWFYLDPHSNVQGPFLDSHMFQWWSQGIYFENSLMMKRKCDCDFSTLQDYGNRFKGVPFNRKDIRVPPLTGSLSVQSPTNPYTNTNAIYRTPQHITGVNDQNYMLQLMSSGTMNQTSDELTKLLQKISIQQRIPPQMVYDECHNGSYPFGVGVGSRSLSNLVNLRLNNPATPAGSTYLEGHTGSRYQNTESWASFHQQNLVNSVWTSMSDDPIISSNPGWSRTTKEGGPSGGPSVVTSIFHENQARSNVPPVTNVHQCNQDQDSWDNLDPAIIKIVPLGETSNYGFTSGNSPMDIMRSAGHVGQNPTWTHTDNVKYPWADLVRKSGTGTGNQIPQSAFNSDHDPSFATSQPKISQSSSSSDENDVKRSKSLEKELEPLMQWSRNYLENKPGIVGVDVDTLLELLVYLESPYEVEATMRENVPEFDSICEFVRIFLEKRRPLRPKLFSDNGKSGQKKSKTTMGKGTGNVDNENDDGDDERKWKVKSRSHLQGSTACKKKNKRKY